MIPNFTGKICDKHGNNMPPDTPPPPRNGGYDSDNWTPYCNCIEFKCAEFLYTCEEMSAGNIDSLLRLWTVTLIPYSADPPFTKHTQMYDTIDSMPLGNVQWEHFTCKYNGDLPSGDIPVWMMAKYEVWY
jgi:Plavaka transposase